MQKEDINNLPESKKIEFLQKYKNNISNLNKSTHFYNEMKSLTFKNLIKFYEKLSFYSGAIITLSITAIISLKESQGDLLNQYKILYIISVISLSITVLTGTFYRFFITLTNFNAGKVIWGNAMKNNISLDHVINKCLYPKKVNSTTKILIEAKNLIKKYQTKEKYNHILSHIIKFLCPIFFVTGIIFLSLYFMSQIFDF